MLLPAFACIFVFHYVPLAGWIIAFKNYNVGSSLLEAEWIGLSQFKTFFLETSDFVYIIRNTLVMNVLTLIVTLSSSFCFAILINELPSRRTARVVQTVSFFPFFVSWVITYSIIHALFSASTGAINVALIRLGIIEKGLDVLGGERYAWPLIVAMNGWKSLGYGSVIFLAAIAGIPREQFEAAEIDGAGRFGRIWHVTVPNMMPTLVVLLILNSGWILSSDFSQYFLFTNPTNWERMEVFDMYVYKFGLKLLNYPYATAVGIVKTVVSLFILLNVNLISRKVHGRAIF